MISLAQLSDRQIDQLDPADRKKLGLKTHSEREHIRTTQSERAIHTQFIGFLRRYDLPFTHSSPVKKSSIQVGTPDFQITRDCRSIYVEFKVPPNSLTTEQYSYFAFLERNGNRIVVATETQEGAAYAKATIEVSQFFNLLKKEG